ILPGHGMPPPIVVSEPESLAAEDSAMGRGERSRTRSLSASSGRRSERGSGGPERQSTRGIDCTHGSLHIARTDRGWRYVLAGIAFGMAVRSRCRIMGLSRSCARPLLGCSMSALHRRNLTMSRRVTKKSEEEARTSSLSRRNFLELTAGASAAALLPAIKAEAALPEAKITSIRVYEGPTVMPLQIPLLQSSMVVMIDTDIGVTGIGEGGTPDSLAPTAARLIGRNPFEITQLWQDMYRSYHYPPGKERLHAIGALDLALWDLKGKVLDAPVYELLGGRVRNYLETYTTGFRGTGRTLQERARECIEAGYRFYRF